MGTNMEEPKMETNGLEEGTNGLAEEANGLEEGTNGLTEEANRGGVG